MKIKLLFFLCNITFLSYASDWSSSPTSFLDMCIIQNQRLENQDRRAFCRLPNKSYLFGILDGHGSDEVADYVANTFPGSFYRYLEKSSSEHQAFNSALRDAEHYALNNLNGGSTALFVYVNNGSAHIANVGDGRAVFGNKHGVAFATQDQTLEREDERNRVVQANGIVYREVTSFGDPVGPWRINGLGMSRALGNAWHKGRENVGALRRIRARVIEKDNTQINLCFEQWPNIIVKELVYKPEIGQVIAEPEYTQLPLTDAHRWLVIASDGLWDTVYNEEAIAEVQDYYDNNDSLEGVATYLCNWAIERGSEDNITVLVVDLLEQLRNKK
jgi:protein phosphatase 1L